ncbi:MAG: hypothetical protein FJY91_00815 [Candidatus Harrisonbacteria bacterium]|nr:hypothetical protein [Candidatus Harrisonbacteria bacterium]
MRYKKSGAFPPDLVFEKSFLITGISYSLLFEFDVNEIKPCQTQVRRRFFHDFPLLLRKEKESQRLSIGDGEGLLAVLVVPSVFFLSIASDYSALLIPVHH